MITIIGISWFLLCLMGQYRMIYSEDVPCARITLDTGENHINCSRRWYGYWPPELDVMDTTNVTSLDLSWNFYLPRVSANALDRYTHLKELNVATNRRLGLLGFVDMVAGVKHAKPKKLCLDSIETEVITLDDYSLCVNLFKRVTHLAIRANNIVSLHIGVFHCVPNLQYLAVGFNFILSIEPNIDLYDLSSYRNISFPYHFLTRLEHFDMSRIYQPPNLYEELYRFNQREFFLSVPEKIYEDDLEVADSNANIWYYNPFDIKYLYCTHVQHSRFANGSPFGYLPSLVFFDLSYIQGRTEVLSAVPLLPNLEIFNLSFCGLEQIEDDAFSVMPHIKELLLANNVLGSHKNNYTEIFKPLKNLQILSLAFNKIYALPKDTFVSHTYLISIDLSGNYLQYIDFPWISSQLTLVDLHLNILKEDFLSKDVRENISNVVSPMTLHIGPEFICTCSSKYFCMWLEENDHHVIIPYYSRSNCSFEDTSIPLEDALTFLESAQSCNSILIPVITAAALFGAFVCVLTVIIHRYKIYITWFLYRLKHKVFCKTRYTVGNERCMYDVYLAVAYDDLSWVKETIMPSLERTKGFKVYLYERDSLGGSTIQDNIVQGLTNSACVVVILSSHFIRDEWRDWELSMAVAAGKSRIAIVKTGDISPDLKMSSMLKSLMLPNPSVTFHEWKPGTCGEGVLMETLELHIRSHMEKYFNRPNERSTDNAV